jgi:hypothetical protein
LEKQWEYNRTVHQLLIDLKSYDLVWRKVSYNILNEFTIPTYLVGLIKIGLNETCSKAGISKHLCAAFPTQNDLKEDALSPLLFSFALE